jgi:hemerythrin-like domain-containing protein
MIQIGAKPATIETPIEHLQACHRRIEQRLATLIKAGALLETDRGTALAAIAKSMEFLDSNGALHTADEEESLFPRLRAKLTEEEIQFLDALEADHVEAGVMHAELRLLVNELNFSGSAVPPDTVSRYLECASRLEALYRAHIRAEDERLAPLARRSLTASEIQGISKEMQDRRHSRPVAGPQGMR